MAILPNPYVLIGGGVVALAIAGSFYVQSTLIHKWHTQYDCVQSGLNCPKGTENIPDLKAKINQMTTAQNLQQSKSEQAVIKVVQGPREVQSIIKEIEAAPAKPCTAPVDSDEVKNAF
jgi:hypothetical protein